MSELNSNETAKQKYSGEALAEDLKTSVGWVRNEAGEWVEPATVESQAQPENEPNQHDKNRELLANSEMGVLLLAAYDAAVQGDPRLAAITIVPYDEQEGARGSAYARGADVSDSGTHEIHVRLGSIEDSLALMNDTLEDVPGLKKMVSEKLLLNLESAEVTPMQLHAFVMLHEMGHLVEYMNNEGTMPALRARQQTEKANLPLSNVRTSNLIIPGSPERREVEANWQNISTAYGVQTIDELVELKNQAHRNMTSESFADNFAAHTLTYEPTLLEQLGSDNLEPYKTLAGV